MTRSETGTASNNNNNANVDLENDDNTSNSSDNGSSSRGISSNNNTEGGGDNTNQDTSISSSNRTTRSMKRSAELLLNLNKKFEILDYSLPSRIDFLKKNAKFNETVIYHYFMKMCDAKNTKDFEDIRRELSLLKLSSETPFIEYIRIAIHHMIIYYLPTYYFKSTMKTAIKFYFLNLQGSKGEIQGLTLKHPMILCSSLKINFLRMELGIVKCDKLRVSLLKSLESRVALKSLVDEAEAQLPATIEDNRASLAFYLYTIKGIMVNCIKAHIIQEAKKTSNAQFLESRIFV
ncbi:hypothetical protein BDC45DRAFT_566960 [Circinella umbellata]|nr:hypothetical protein BDC45DRAFT_566960 [Circinella umbellata]